jgi:hypothetical protein
MTARGKTQGNLLLILSLLAGLFCFAWFLHGHIKGDDPAKNSKTTRSLQVAAVALECFRLLEGRYPEGDRWSEVVEKIEDSCPTEDLLAVEDSWNNDLIYSKDREDYVLKSCGSDLKCDSAITPEWIDGSYEQDIIIRSGRWQKVRWKDNLVDVQIEAEGRPDSAGNDNVFDISFRVEADSELLAMDLVAELIPCCSLEAKGHERWPVREIGNRIEWKLPGKVPIELAGRAITDHRNACILAQVAHLTAIDRNLKNNVALWCVDLDRQAQDDRKP